MNKKWYLPYKGNVESRYIPQKKIIAKIIPVTTDIIPHNHASLYGLLSFKAAKAGKIKLAKTTYMPTSWTDEVIASAKIK